MQDKDLQRRLILQYTATLLLTHSENIDTVAEKILKLIGEYLGFELGALWLFDEKLQILQCKKTWISLNIKSYQFESINKKLQFAANIEILEQILSTCEPRWIVDTIKEHKFMRSAFIINNDLKSMLCFPILIKNQGIGAIEFFTQRRQVPKIQLINIAKGFGIQVGHFIERKQIEEKLSQLAAIVEFSNDAIFSRTLEGIILSWNKGAEKLYGYTAKEAIGKSITMLVPEDKKDELSFILKKLKSGKNIKNLEAERVRKDGARIIVSASVSPIKDSAGKIVSVSVITRDITALKQEEKQRDMFVGIAGHELRNTLAGIKIFGQILQKRISSYKDAKSIFYLHKIDSKVDKLTKLINDLLDITKIKAGKLEFYDEVFNLDYLLNEIIKELEPSLKKRMIIEGNAKKLVIADKSRIEQVLTNLISNAIKYSSEKDKIIIKTFLNKNKVVLSIQDFGIGIPQDKQERIFEPFYQINNQQKSKTAGLGLGLHISKEIIKHYKGYIWVKSTKNKGSTFYFTLPLKQNK